MGTLDVRYFKSRPSTRNCNNLAFPQSSAILPLGERLGTTPSETWRDCIVELHEDDESDAQICVDDAEQGTERI